MKDIYGKPNCDTSAHASDILDKNGLANLAIPLKVDA